MYDSRLFNQTGGLDQGFGAEDSYTVYDKAMGKGELLQFCIGRRVLRGVVASRFNRIIWIFNGQLPSPDISRLSRWRHVTHVQTNVTY